MGGRGTVSRFTTSISKAFVKTAVAGYQDRDYLDINRILRDKRQTRLDVLQTKEMLFKKIQALDIATTRTPLKTDRTLYRGINEKNKFISKILSKGVGYKFKDNAFISTSKTKTELASGVEYNLIIRAKKGQKGIDVNYINKKGKWHSENEYILPRGTSFKVRQIKTSSHSKYAKDIYLDIL